MKSVLHIGIECAQFSSKGMEKGFRAAGFTEYSFFNWQNCRFSEGILGTQARMIQAAKSTEPDLIFMHLQNSDICDEETIQALSEIGLTVNYTFDIRSKEINQWMYDLAPFFGLTIFACKEDADMALMGGIPNVRYMHSSCDSDAYRPVILSDAEKRKYPEIVFIGNNYERTNLDFEKSKEREDMVAFMKQEFGDRFGVFGINWGAGSRIINAQEEAIIYSSAKVAICHNNFLRTAYCSDRQWRTMACGVPVVVQNYPNIWDDFDEEKPLFYWETFDDLKFCCQHIIKENWLTYDLGNDMRKQFFKKHTWRHRIEQIKTMIHEQSGK